jgi:2-polyprenyl-3-methyl-5-hydroxy-6-metoxy-1,4-benzoquinol methylase
MMFGTREEFTYFLCKNCGCLQIAEVPSELSKYYPASYYSFQGDTKPPRHRSLPFIRSLLERLRAQYAILGKGHKLAKFASLFVDLPPEISPTGPLIVSCCIQTRNAKILDVGCGDGSGWLNALQALGFTNLFGVDPFIERDIDDNGIQIIKGQVENVVGQFDLITLHHSLEHIPDQFGTLQAVRSRLAQNGHCLIRVPLVSSLVWDMYGTDWVELDAPRHLYLHSRNSLAALASRVGLELIKTTWDSSAFEFYGSEQYRRDLPLVAENSYWINPSRSDFTFREMAEFSELASKANREERGGRGCFIFRRVDR